VDTNASDALQDLISRAADGDKRAQQALLTRYWPLLHKAVRARKMRLGRALDRREETEDIEQAAALRVLSELPKHAWQGRSAFASWVGKLAALEVVDTYRHHRAKKRDVKADTGESIARRLPREGSGVETRMDRDRRLEALMKKVSTLKDDYGTALLMHHMGFSHAEIGAALACSDEAARKLVARAHRKLVDLP
jgi:RNA polymerase sigma factor (sigma-70 family)